MGLKYPETMMAFFSVDKGDVLDEDDVLDDDEDEDKDDDFDFDDVLDDDVDEDDDLGNGCVCILRVKFFYES